MRRYAGRFCIQCLISFIFGFLGFLNPKAKWVLILEIFQNLGFLPRFACRPIVLGFLGTMWFVDLDHLFRYKSDHFCIFCCIGMRVASIVSILFSVDGLVALCSLLVLLL